MGKCWYIINHWSNTMLETTSYRCAVHYALDEMDILMAWQIFENTQYANDYYHMLVGVAHENL